MRTGDKILPGDEQNCAGCAPKEMYGNISKLATNMYLL